MIGSSQKLLMARAGVTPQATNFPVVETTSTYISLSAASSHTVNLPSGITSGDLLLMVYTIDSDGLINSITDWTIIPNIMIDNVSAGFGFLYKVADGSEGATLEVPCDSVENLATVCLRISGASGSVEYVVKTNNPADALEITPSWGAAANLWVVSYHFGQGNARVTSPPSGYTLAGATESTVDVETACAYKSSFSATENPPVATVINNFSGGTMTFAIEPA